MIVKVLSKAAQKRKLFNKLKAKRKSGKLLSEYDRILKEKPKGKRKNAKAPIFLKHQKRKIKKFMSKAGSFVKKEAKDLYNFAKEDPLIAVPAAVTGLGLGLGLNYLTSKTNKAGDKK